MTRETVNQRLHRRSARRARLAVAVLFAACARAGVPMAPLPPSRPSAAAEEIVTRTNAERRQLRLPPLARNSALMGAAQLQADQMAAKETMAHELRGVAYPTFGDRLAAVGYHSFASGENVAEGYPTAAAVVAGWMTSPGHRANIVSTHYTEMGAGVARSKRGDLYYAQAFASPR